MTAPRGLIDQVRALAEKATPGPWETSESEFASLEKPLYSGDTLGPQRVANRRFKDAMRTLGPELAEALEAQITETEAAQAEADHYIKHTYVDPGANDRVPWKDRATQAEAERDRLREIVRHLALAYIKERRTIEPTILDFAALGKAVAAYRRDFPEGK